MREALLWESLSNDQVQCLLCERRCVIPPGESGFCRTRVNRSGRLYTLTYGNLSAAESRPIEIKPFYHFWPGSSAYTISTWSCNFDCPWCQNWALSKFPPPPPTTRLTPPEEVVRAAVQAGDQGVCISFNEPTLLFEYMIDLFPLAKDHGLYTCIVSNGYLTEAAIHMLHRAGLDGFKIDVKGDSHVYRKYCKGVDAQIIWRNAHLAQELGLHVELVCLLVTGLCDNDRVVEWIVQQALRNVSRQTPIHFTRYFPAYHYHEPPTPIDFLERAYRIARQHGFKYVYLGNVGDHPYGNTYCPTCGALLLKRRNFFLVFSRLTAENRCPSCGTQIPITGKILR